MRFCPNCNSAVYDDRATTCPECGKPMNQNVCPGCGRPLQPGEVCPHCSSCRPHGERYAARTDRPQPAQDGLSMWAYMGLILLAMVPVVGLVCMIVWACGVGNNPHLARFARGMLLARAALFLIGLILFGAMLAAMEPLIDDLENWLYNYEEYGSYYDDYGYGYDEYGDGFNGDDDPYGGNPPQMDELPGNAA